MNFSINKAVIHRVDMLNRNVNLSQNILTRSEDLNEYYRKKIEKCLLSSDKRTLLTGENHHLITTAVSMLENPDIFLKYSREITRDFQAMGQEIEDMPNFDLLIADITTDHAKMVLIIKLNYQPSYETVKITDSSGRAVFRILEEWKLPSIGKNVDEAIMIDISTKRISVIEKKFLIDGKKGYYLNEQYIKGEPLLTDREKLKYLEKVVKKIAYENGIDDSGAIIQVRQLAKEGFESGKDISIYDIVENVFDSDQEAAAEAGDILSDLGVNADSCIENIPETLKKQKRCRIVLDDDRVIEMSAEEYLGGVNFETAPDNAEGSQKIVLTNIQNITVK